MTARLSLLGVGYRYPGALEPALQGIDLQVGPGEVVCVVGPSGSGKSTLLRVVTGLSGPHDGRVVIDGSDLSRERPERRPVAMVFQGFALFPHLTVAANIGFGLRARKEPGIADRVTAAAERLELAPLMDRRPGELSGGERQRVALARALVRDPAVFCLDEPLASLDPTLRASARRLLAEVLRAEGRGALFVTHDQVEAMTLGDRIAVLRAGALEQVGTPREVYASPASPFVAGFIGSPPATVLSTGAAAALGLPTDHPVAVRPESVQLVDGGVPGLVTEVAHLGPVAHVTVQVTDGQLVATSPPELAPTVGAHVGVRVIDALRFP